MSGSLKLLDKGAESWKKLQIHRHWGPGALDERPGMPLCSVCLWIGKPQHLPTCNCWILVSALHSTGFGGSADLCAALNCDDRWSAGATQEPPWRTSLVTWVGTTTLLKRRPLTKVHKLIVSHKLLYQLLYYVAFQLGSCFINKDNEADFHGGSN